jgi:hypothetical protein
MTKAKAAVSHVKIRSPRIASGALEKRGSYAMTATMSNAVAANIERAPAMIPEPPRARPMKKPGRTVPRYKAKDPKDVRRTEISKANTTPQIAIRTIKWRIVN